MIALRSLTRSHIPRTMSLLALAAPALRFPFCNSSPNAQPSSQPQQEHAFLTSPEALSKFTQLITESEVSSLEQAAELLAKLEFIVEKNEKTLHEYEAILSTCQPGVKSLIERMQMLRDNIRLQDEELESIDQRADKQILQCRNYSISAIAKEVLEVADALARSRKSYHEVMKALKEADKQMKAILEVYGIEEFDPVGQIYDPNKQEALATMPTEDKDLKNKVAGTIRTGYTIKGRLLRSAHVSIYL